MKEQERVLPRLAVPEITAPLAVALDLTPEPGDVASNLLLAEREIRAAKEAHPDLRWVVLPELISCGYSNLASVHRYAEHAEDGPSARFFVSLAHELGLYIAYGFPELVPGGVRDSVNLAGPEGILLTYGKKHLVMEAGENSFFIAGDGPLVADAGGLQVALAVCWDLGFPEFVREAAARGADLILAPAGWRDPFGPQYGLACAARALDNGVYVASANQIGAYPEARFGAPGGVYGPDGLRASEDAWGRSVAGIDADFARSWRTSFGDTLPWSRSSAPAPPLEVVA